MKIERIQKWRNRFEQKLLIFALIIAQAGFAALAGATYNLPASRSVTWQGNVGVNGDIPSRTTIYKTLSPSGGDDTSAIQTTINNCPSGQVVALAAGTFSVKSPINLKSGITLRGAGMGTTKIKGASGMTGAYVMGTSSPSLGSSVSISAGLNKGSTTITTSSAHGWSVGDIVLIDQLNNTQDDPPVINVGYKGDTCTWCGRSSGTRALGQVARIVAVPSSTTATLEIPLYWNYDASLSPQGTKISGITKDAGIEDLTIDNSLSGTSSQSTGTISLRGASNCWLLRVESTGSYTAMVSVYRAYRNTIRSCKFHEGVPATPINGTQYSTSRSYGIWSNQTSANLFENNQLYHLRIPIKLDGPASGNVIAYNYISEIYSDSSAAGFQLAGITTHGPHPIMNLIEGNYVQGRLRADNVFGSSSHNTYFRNRVVLDPSRNSGGWDCDLHKSSQYYNFVGNVLGTPGVESTYELNNVSTSGKKSAFRFGYISDGDADASGNDAQVSATVLRHGNWDSATKGVVWNGSDDRNLPASLYLTDRPDWWGTIQWPAIGPDLTPMYPSMGAVGNGTPWESKTVLSPPANLKAQ